jgi:hypothetical protein
MGDQKIWRKGIRLSCEENIEIDSEEMGLKDMPTECVWLW